MSAVDFFFLNTDTHSWKKHTDKKELQRPKRAIYVIALLAKFRNCGERGGRKTVRTRCRGGVQENRLLSTIAQMHI